MTTLEQPNHRRKLIEVDLPLDVINKESAREKSIRHGHPSTLHIWWSRKPLAACRAVIFASIVDDPSSCPDEFPTEQEQRDERGRLHEIIRQLVVWENTDERRPEARRLLDRARLEIARSVARSRGHAPPDGDDPADVLRYLAHNALPIYDPFAGGGSIPLEAQRLGLRAVASDLNPVAVLINKALIELPHRFANRPPVNPEADPMGMNVGRGKKQRRVAWRGSAGLADDLRYYGRWMRERAHERIGHLYPKAKLPDGSQAPVIAWLWARTVPCPNPACGIAMPLMTTFQLSRKPNNPHWTKPVVDRGTKSVSFVVQDSREGIPLESTVVRGGKGAVCLACNGAVPHAYIREQARAGSMGAVMTAIVAEGDRKRLFLSPTDEHVGAALSAKPRWRPGGRLPEQALGFRVQRYGFTHWSQLFTERQLTALTTFSDLTAEAAAKARADGADQQYADTLSTYLALAIGKTTDMCSVFTTWHLSGEKMRNLFARQTIPMVWDFSDVNLFSDSSGNWMAHIEWIARVVERFPLDVNSGEAHQADASTTIHAEGGPVIVTDPPYYDNIGYADLSDFFYVWLRPLLRNIYPDLFAGILTPKSEEMVAAPVFENTRERFESLMSDTLRLIRQRCSPEFPSSIFYAYKQQKEQRGGRTSTGWETMLSALVNAGFQVIGTWPMRTELANRPRSQGANALASSVILVCRPRPGDAPPATRRQFLDALELELPAALDQLTREGHVAPTDLAQAAIGPGMKVYSRFGRVETIAGEPVPIREALAEINRVIAEYHQREQGELDPPSRFCMDWLRQHGYDEAKYGEAELLARAMNVSVEGLRDDHRLLAADAGRVSLIPPDGYGPGRRPTPGGMTAWEGCFRMAYHLDKREDAGASEGAARVALDMGADADSVERLARVLYDHYDRKNDSANAVTFDNLAASWQHILTETRRLQSETQGALADL